VVVSAPHAVPDKRVVLRVESRPEGAQVIRIQDGEVLGQTPWQVTQPAAEGRLQLRLRLPNHEDQDVSVAASVDQQAVVQLVPARPKLDRPGTGDQRKTESNKPAKAKPRTPAGKWETPKIID
jgi:serine/threonine-protein kinase